ncbi:hypothetical protein [Halocatena pleomorpha]|uniref:Metal-dependent hydrolase n=1 Tax=Halocatena pleomorpha TaxID=1785090 RepID=A0A3P3RH03_9EURY|nr:hypothetical protein [Halocatena pleomorpha]RRJ32817.1 hypothetical protein EIK79_03940 [Halocatena pleomorpha]
MPFTLYHLGPALLIGLPLRRWIDLLTLCTASVVLDIWPLLAGLGVLPGPYHRVEHTYLGGAVVAGMLTVGMVLGAHQFPTQFDRWRSDTGGLTGLVVPGLIGTLLHVTLDSVTHPTMDPFTPIAGNPFSHLFTLMELTIVCATLLFICLAWLVLLHTARRRSSEESSGLFAIGPLHMLSISSRHRLAGVSIAGLGIIMLLLVSRTDIFIAKVIWGASGGIILFNGLYLNGVRFR